VLYYTANPGHMLYQSLVTQTDMLLAIVKYMPIQDTGSPSCQLSKSTCYRSYPCATYYMYHAGRYVISHSHTSASLPSHTLGLMRATKIDHFSTLCHLKLFLVYQLLQLGRLVYCTTIREHSGWQSLIKLFVV